MAWSALFDRTHILKGISVDAEIELQCRKCNTLFYTINVYYIGYADIRYVNPEEKERCSHSIKELVPTKKWNPVRDIRNRAADPSWTSLFDYSHILEGAPVDANIELECRKCKTLFLTKNTYYIGYSEIFYVNPDDKGNCKHGLEELKPTKRWFA